MNRALSILALAALSACGGGGGSGGGFMPVAAPAPVQDAHQLAPLQAPNVTYPNCNQVTPNQINCDLIPGESVGAAVPAGMFASFTNRTGAYIQINQIDAYTEERKFWSEYCAYLGEIKDLTTAQSPAGKGEVGCATKNIGEDYAPMRFGTGTGLAVAPGEMVMLNAHTDPEPTNHTYFMSVAKYATGLQSWRQPQVDYVIPCNDQMQATEMRPWRNETDHQLHLTGASIYAETPSSRTPNKLAAACIYVMTADGSATKYTNCDGSVSARGEVAFPTVTIEPGEYVAAQASNACSSGNHWNWVAFLRVY